MIYMDLPYGVRFGSNSLASSDADFVTGVTVDVTGGLWDDATPALTGPLGAAWLGDGGGQRIMQA